MPRLVAALMALLVLAWLPGCSKRTVPEPAAKACTMPAHCDPGQACIRGRCMTDLTRRQMAAPEARRARDEVEAAQQQIEERRDRAIEAAGRER